MKFIDFHDQSLKAGKMVDVDGNETSGLCDAFSRRETFRLFMPTCDDIGQLGVEGKDTWLWASDSSKELWHHYTNLRQTIVLFCAAIEGEI